MTSITFVIGASGAGKTTLIRALERELASKGVRAFYFDEIIPDVGPPLSGQEGDAWQQRVTLEWCRRFAAYGGSCLLEGQTRYGYIEEACREVGIAHWNVLLVESNGNARRERLQGRGQAELASSEMTAWAEWLRRDAEARGTPILDTSGQTIAESSAQLLRMIIEG